MTNNVETMESLVRQFGQEEAGNLTDVERKRFLKYVESFIKYTFHKGKVRPINQTDLVIEVRNRFEKRVADLFAGVS